MLTPLSKYSITEVCKALQVMCTGKLFWMWKVLSSTDKNFNFKLSAD